MSNRSEHAFQGHDEDHCSRCWEPKARHRARPSRASGRPRHLSRGDPCRDCGLSAVEHRGNAFTRVTLSDYPCVGVDGEGVGRGPHRYAYLSAVDEHGNKLGSICRYLEKGEAGLGTWECLDFLVGLRHAGSGKPVQRLFGFSVNYDMAKILRELDSQPMGELMRPELRVAGKSHRPVAFPIERGLRYAINYLRGRWTISRERWDKNKLWVTRSGKPRKGGWQTEAKVVWWDIFAFYQSSFVKALDAWKVGTDEERARIEEMKMGRDGFRDDQRTEIEDYCDSECALLGQLVRKLIVAHETADIRLTSFHGPGSTASVVLRRWSVHKLKMDPPEPMRICVKRGFFGGRFEIARIGDVLEKIYTADINSAYPTAMLDFPCLIHGKWERVAERRQLHRRVERARLALVHARVRDSRKARDDWGPLPWRAKDGSIVFPRSGVETWCWREEYLRAREHFCQVEGLEAWVYETECDCAPFRDLVSLYRRRFEFEADADGSAAGKVFKLAINSCFGKLAQSIGQDPPFRSLIWAGCTTSFTRAMLLQAIGDSDPWTIVQVATDSVWSLREIKLDPIDTGTGDLKKPLGGWARDAIEGGAFLCRPGMNFPIDLEERAEDEIRTRGISRKDFGRHADDLRDYFNEQWRRGRDGDWFSPEYEIKAASKKNPGGMSPRFRGMKTSTRLAKNELGRMRWARDPNFGEWISGDHIVGFQAHPKRRGATQDRRLLLRGRRLGAASELWCDGMTRAYDPKMLGPTRLELIRQREIAEEQPEG